MRARSLAALIAVAGLGFAGAASASDHARVLHLVETHATPQLKVVDANEPGPSAGDHVAVRDDVRLASGGLGGPLREECTLIDPAPKLLASTFECSGSIALPGGTLLFGGPFVPMAPEQTQAVTGGTGVFRAAAGEAVVRAEDDEIVVRLVR